MDENRTEIPAWVKARFPPDQRAAVDYFRRLVDADMLREIAEADYGNDVEKHLEALKPVWSGAPLGELGHWFPMEVLELDQWSDPDNPEHYPGPERTRGHIKRAFSCAVLLATPNFEPDIGTLIQMLNSTFVVGYEAAEAVGRFLAWQCESPGVSDDRTYFAVATAAVWQHLDPEMDLTQEENLARWVKTENEREFSDSPDRSDLDVREDSGVSIIDAPNRSWRALFMKMTNLSRGRPLGALFAPGNIA